MVFVADILGLPLAWWLLMLGGGAAAASGCRGCGRCRSVLIRLPFEQPRRHTSNQWEALRLSLLLGVEARVVSGREVSRCTFVESDAGALASTSTCRSVGSRPSPTTRAWHRG